MSKLEQCAAICFLALNGLRLQQIPTELSDVNHKQAFYLPGVEKWQLRYLDRLKELEDEPRSGRPKKTDFVGSIAELLHESHLYRVRRHIGD
jgi:hypothetical protein